MIYFVATKHAEYAERDFPEGSTVIDPWRYITDRPGITVRRIGANRPELISLLCPTRGRPEQFWRMAESALTTATYPRQVGLITYVDDDDPSRENYLHYSVPAGERHPWWLKRVGIGGGPRILLSESWNECYKAAQGSIFMHCGDDIVFRTPGWDQIVRDEFEKSKDKLILVHGDDCSPNTDALATHGFLHRRWVETVGYFLPPLFSSDWNDVWLTEVADMIGRRIKVPIVTDHLHYAFGKAEHDQTYAERELRGQKDNVAALFVQTKSQRVEDAAKLQAALA